jgi:hypothetical protein
MKDDEQARDVSVRLSQARKYTHCVGSPTHRSVVLLRMSQNGVYERLCRLMHVFATCWYMILSLRRSRISALNLENDTTFTCPPSHVLPTCRVLQKYNLILGRSTQFTPPDPLGCREQLSYLHPARRLRLILRSNLLVIQCPLGQVSSFCINELKCVEMVEKQRANQ